MLNAETRTTMMTQVIGRPGGGANAEEILGELESSEISVGWNRGRLSEKARMALSAILERHAGVADRPFDLQHGALLLLRCRMLPNKNDGEFSFDGSRRRRPAI
jgi:hypothetical protein